MCNNILNILKFIIKFNKYIIIVIDLKHFQNFPHCGVHLKRWKKKVHQVRKKNEHMLASKWINENITVNLYTNNPLSFPPAKIYSSIYHQPESRQFSHSLITLWQSFILEFHFASWQYFFFQQKVKNFCCSRFLKFLVRTNFCNLLFKQQNINKEQNLTCLTFFTG